MRAGRVCVFWVRVSTSVFVRASDWQNVWLKRWGEALRARGGGGGGQNEGPPGSPRG